MHGGLLKEYLYEWREILLITKARELPGLTGLFNRDLHFERALIKQDHEVFTCYIESIYPAHPAAEGDLAYPVFAVKAEVCVVIF